MIFVTVGSSNVGNDQLIQRMDKFAPLLDEPVIMQIAMGKYEPHNCEWFRLAPSLEHYFNEATLVVGSGGVGTTFELLRRHVKFVGVSNPNIPDKHQDEILEKLSSEGYLMWCKDLDKLKDVLMKLRSLEFKRYVPPKCSIEQIIIDFLNRS